MKAQEQTAFHEQMDRLIGTLRPGQVAGDFAIWLGEMDEVRASCGVPEQEHQVLGAAITSLLLASDEHDQPLRWPIRPLQFRHALEQAVRNHRTPPAALPAPERHAVQAIDPNDPYSCTPNERERWAREDQAVRQWAGRLPKALPDYAPAWDVEALQRNQSVANWPNLTPAERRAKERRIEIERRAAMKAIARVVGRPEPEFDELAPLPGAIPTRPRPELMPTGPEWPGAAG